MSMSAAPKRCMKGRESLVFECPIMLKANTAVVRGMRWRQRIETLIGLSIFIRIYCNINLGGHLLSGKLLGT